MLGRGLCLGMRYDAMRVWPWRKDVFLRTLLLLSCLLLLACSGPRFKVPAAPQRVTQPAPPQGGSFAARQLAKSDIDRVADRYHEAMFASLWRLADKLYRRNPAEWRKSGARDAEDALARLKARLHDGALPAITSRHVPSSGRDLFVAPESVADQRMLAGVQDVQLALTPEYPGDRVQALIGGLMGMLHQAFNEKQEFFLLDDLDPQSFYNSARNLEITVWRLSNARAAEGQLLLLTNAAASGEEPQNLSFEREFGKLIAHCDLLAQIIADKSNRTIVKVLQSLATAVFLPVASP